MKIRTSLYVQLMLLVLVAGIGAYYYMRLPDVVPTHFDFRGKPDQYGSKLMGVLMGPAMVMFGILLTLALPKISPKKYEIDAFEATFGYAMILVSCLFSFISVWILRGTAGGKLEMNGGTFMVAMFAFFALLGNVLGKVRRNFFMGIRTPWTLASEPVWDATHRVAGRLWFVGGIIGAVLCLAGLPMQWAIALLLVIAIWPCVQSYFIYRKLG